MATRKSPRRKPSAPSAKAVSTTKIMRSRAHTKPDRLTEYQTSEFRLKQQNSILLLEVFGYATEEPEDNLCWLAGMIKNRGGRNIMGATLDELDEIVKFDMSAIGKQQAVPRKERLAGMPDPWAESIEAESLTLHSECVYDFLAAFQWWIDAANWMPCPPAHIRKADALLASVLEAYMPASRIGLSRKRIVGPFTSCFAGIDSIPSSLARWLRRSGPT